MRRESLEVPFRVRCSLRAFDRVRDALLENMRYMKLPAPKNDADEVQQMMRMYLSGFVVVWLRLVLTALLW